MPYAHYLSHFYCSVSGSVAAVAVSMHASVAGPSSSTPTPASVSFPIMPHAAPPSGPPTAPPAGPPPPSQDPQLQQMLEQLEGQKSAISEQVKQSEQNLAAQYQSLISQQQLQIDEAIQDAQNAKLAELCAECQVDSKQLEDQLQPIIESCTKDAISVRHFFFFAILCSVFVSLLR